MRLIPFLRTGTLKFISQTFVIRAFQQAGTQLAMNINTESDNSSRELIQIISLYLCASVVQNASLPVLFLVGFHEGLGLGGQVGVAPGDFEAIELLVVLDGADARNAK